MKNTVLLALALALLAGSVLALRNYVREQRQSEDFPEGAHWLCLQCREGFTVSLEQVNQWAGTDPAGGFACPKCKSGQTARAKKCPLPACGKFYLERNLVIDDKVCCPICKSPLP
ncbi:MAG: hypothetical protein FJ404_05400 [Verrucomicrobia bacterium]|nr:hypothetical protein [Verrucomicrobiota bacterium]